MSKFRIVGWAAGAATLGALFIAGCHSPMEGNSEQELRDEMIGSQRALQNAVAGGPIVELKQVPSEMQRKFTVAQQADLDKTTSPSAFDNVPMELGTNLMGESRPDTVSLSLRRAVELAMRYNLDSNTARIVPAIGETQVTQAEAAFDAVLYTNFDWSDTHTPKPAAAPADVLEGTTLLDTNDLTTGIKKQLSTGGTFSTEVSYGRNYTTPTPFETRSWDSGDVLMNLTQPLLRNFGSDVARSQVALARSARKQAVEDLRTQLLTTAETVEQDYWQLVLARQTLLIQQKLLDQTREDENQLELRAKYDVNPVRLREAQNFVAQRTVSVIQARENFRQASDTLKRQLNAPELPLSGETLVIPIESPAGLPVSYSLLDAVTTAINRRPELAKSLMEIEDASTRQRVADNARLPQLDLNATMRYNGVSDQHARGNGNGIAGVFDEVYSANFVDYITTFQFSIPLGNRAAEGLYRQRQLERRGSVLAYQRNVQDVVLQVKNALRQIKTDYELSGWARTARTAAADNLRALLAQEKSGQPLTPEFLLDLKLTTEQRLADAETQEIQVLTDYNTSIAKFYQAIGTLLERDGVVFHDAEDTRILKPEDTPASDRLPNTDPLKPMSLPLP